MDRCGAEDGGSPLSGALNILSVIDVTLSPSDIQNSLISSLKYDRLTIEKVLSVKQTDHLRLKAKKQPITLGQDGCFFDA